MSDIDEYISTYLEISDFDSNSDDSDDSGDSSYSSHSSYNSDKDFTIENIKLLKNLTIKMFQNTVNTVNTVNSKNIKSKEYVAYKKKGWVEAIWLYNLKNKNKYITVHPLKINNYLKNGYKIEKKQKKILNLIENIFI